ncbi:MAG TPA: DUF952 domain-containing protein [Anaerolineales bacterium]|nr:DUF952 domain-containing protein [Anaerolineales bacterium]
MIIHLTTKSDWETAQRLGEYRAASLASEGFIHCSTAEQILKVANFLYRGQSGLILLWLEPERVRAEIRWEPPVHPAPSVATPLEPKKEELFPHIYGVINLDAVVNVVDFLPDADGMFRQVPGKE